jgi:hypothetical protein
MNIKSYISQKRVINGGVRKNGKKMKEFNELRLTCMYREKQNCTYWDRETQCHRLACPIISQKLQDQTEQLIQKQIIESLDSFDKRHLDEAIPKDRQISKNTQKIQDKGTSQKLPLIKETQGTTVITLATKQQEIEITPHYEESLKEINQDNTSESKGQDLIETANSSVAENLYQQPQVFQERQETILIPLGQKICDRCGEPINTQTCTRIQNSNGEIFYIHPNGQCYARWDKIQEARKKWLMKHK